MALPWAHPTPASVCDSVEDEASRGVPLAEVSLTLEDEVQVRWKLEEENEAGVIEANYVWWGAKVVGPAPAGTVLDPAVQGPAFEILYEPRGSFSEERAMVAFTKEEHVLRAVDQEGAPCLWWRKKGDAWEEPPEEEEDSEEGEEEGEEGAVRRLAAAGIRPGEDGHFGVRDVLGAVGLVDGDDEDPLANMDAVQQRIVAEGMRALVDTFEEYTREASRDADGKVVVSAEDVHAMFARAREKRQRRE